MILTSSRALIPWRLLLLLVFGAGVVLAPLSASAITIPTVPVGDVGNANDSTGFGRVAYAYNIGTTEVTNAQYAAFLNEKAKSDPLGLYRAAMGSDIRGGITQSGVSGSFTYTTRANMGDKPVNDVTWYSAIRFANWLNNGRGNGDTETGAYTLGPLDANGVPVNGDSITRNAGATWFLTSENEWYKAAYYQPAAQGGDSDNYWLYATRTNSPAPTMATADLVGNISNPGANVANYNKGADWNGQDGNVTTVGSAGPLSNSFYGTADQGGNLHEWNEALINGFRGLRGGSWTLPSIFLPSSFRDSGGQTFGYSDVGFRVATVPEPSSLTLSVGAVIALMLWRRTAMMLILRRPSAAFVG
jgi:formylglycine-generating enzyme required for sulfatase activity